MSALAEWIVEFEWTEEWISSLPDDGSKSDARNLGLGWKRLAEGAYKECRGHFLAGTMNARPLESCVRRAHRMVTRSSKIPVRLRNIKTGEVIPADIFA